MAIKVYGLPLSTCTKRVLTVLVEKKVDYTLVPVDLTKGEHKKPEFLALQPFGKVPVLEDDGFLVYESRAICKYIATKYAGQGTKLIPSPDDLQANAIFEQACSIELCYFNTPASWIPYEKLFKQILGLGTADEIAVAKYAAELDATLAGYEAILSKQKYLGGNELTIADIYHLPAGTMVREVGYAPIFDKYQHVKKWFDEISDLESWKSVDVRL